jgi:hypothetical protein
MGFTLFNTFFIATPENAMAIRRKSAQAANVATPAEKNTAVMKITVRIIFILGSILCRNESAG